MNSILPTGGTVAPEKALLGNMRLYFMLSCCFYKVMKGSADLVACFWWVQKD